MDQALGVTSFSFPLPFHSYSLSICVSERYFLYRRVSSEVRAFLYPQQEILYAAREIGHDARHQFKFGLKAEMTMAACVTLATQDSSVVDRRDGAVRLQRRASK